jgi:uncharacterized protein YhaN
MLFTKLKLNYFGRFHNREIELKPGINLIYGENEAGKSTIHMFIRGMLFGIERMRGRGAASREDIYARYLPWDYPGAYGGSMDVRIGDRQYRLQRSFHAGDKNFTVTDLATGRETVLKEGLISEIVPGLTEAAFKNTISIEQLKAQTDSELAAQVRNYITNLSIAKSKEVDVAKAVSLLNEQRKQLEPTQNTAALKALQAEIDDGLAKEERMDQLTLQLKDLLLKEQQLKEQKEAALHSISGEEAGRMEQLPAILEKYRSFQDLSKQLASLEAQARELQARISSGDQKRSYAASIKEDIKEAEKLRLKLSEQEKREQELRNEKEAHRSRLKGNLFIRIASLCTAVILIPVLTGFHILGIIAAAVLFAAGLASNFIMSRKGGREQSRLEAEENGLSRQMAADRADLENIFIKYQVSREEELAGKQEEALKDYFALENAGQQLKELEQRKGELEDNRDALYETIMKYLQYFIREEELSGSSLQRLQEAIRQRRQEASDRTSELSGQLDSCRLRIEKLKWEISALEGNEEELLKNQERYDALLQSQRDNAVELEAVKLALSTIQELSADIHDSFGQQLNRAVSEVISEVTGQKYNDLKIDEKLEVRVGFNGAYVLLDRLSAGTVDQVYFALRLAVADLLLGKDEVPLLLDDSFALYDEPRVCAALARIAQRQQTLLFTCHKRERALLEDMGLPYHFIDLSCR